MHRYKKLIVCLLAFVLAISIVGCGATEDGAKNTSEKKIEKSEKQETDQQEKKTDSDKAVVQSEEEKAEADAGSEQNTATIGTSEEKENQTADQSTKNQPVSNTQVASTKSQPTQASQPPQQATQPAAPAPTQPSNPAPQEKVTISVIGPSDHRNILGSTNVNIKEGDTVYDVLLKTGLQVDARTDYGSKYVEGIENIYEGDYPGQSGWTYKLNGVLVQMSASKAKVKDGDKIVWEYVGG